MNDPFLSDMSMRLRAINQRQSSGGKNMKDFGIRNKTTGDITARFDDPIEARSHIADPENEEVAERQLENIVERFPDGKAYITGVQERWTAFKI